MAIAAASTRATFYVSPTGSDDNVGTLRRPFLTVQRAQASTRREGASGATIILRGGTYFLPQPIRLTHEDGGLTIEAYGREKPVLSGGMPIRFSDRGGLWRAPLADGRKFTSLYVNGERRFRPRLPKKDYYTISDILEPTTAAKGRGFDRFKFTPGDIEPEWAGGDVEVLSIHIWEASRLRIRSVDQDVVTFTGPTGYDADWAKFQKGGRYFVDNVPGPLAPGEWRIDGRELVYRPRPGESLASADVIAPVLSQLLVADQTQVVTIQNVAFRHTNWVLPPQGRMFPQAAADFSGAVEARKTVGLKMIGCEVSGVDGYGVDLGQGCRECEFVNGVLRDLGAGGIKIGTQNYEQDESQVASHNVVKDNVIEDGGRLHPAGVGVWIGHSPYNRIEHNEIVDFYYTGISVGWSWGYGASNAHHNMILRDHIHRIGQGVLSDMGGIYLLGVAPGTTVKGNLIHDVKSFDYGGWGIYPDEGSSNLLIEGNVVYGTKSPGYHQHYGKDNVVRDNVFAMGREAQIRRSREEEHRSFSFERNIAYWANAPLFDGAWSNNHFMFDGNVYWRTDEKPIDFAGMSLDQWRAKGQDVHSTIEDPMFVDPSHGDYHLRPDSPLRKLGFGLFEQAMDAWPAVLPDKRRLPPAFPVQ